ncbi:chromophore lyase CpcT/CpeT [Methanothrix soehngenii]|jgi:hypothetical protein|uniref:chromophore lyase CpcT/CpeT n=1 Tax=Methanothrix soehngenii TaxID=2223 RepID=UPI00300C6346
MTRGITWLAIVALQLQVVPLAASAAELDSVDPHSRDLVVLASWYSGEWDNDEQLWFEADHRAQRPVAHRHRRLHATHARIALPWLSERVFYVEEYEDDDPGQITRQRLITFDSDIAAGGIRSRQFFFRRPADHASVHTDPARVTALSERDLLRMTGCDIVWRKEAAQYRGTVSRDTCVEGDGDDRRGLQYEALLAQDKYWRVDRSLRASDGSLYAGHHDGEPFKLRRAERFLCDVGFPTDYQKGPQPTDQNLRNLSIHTQGGELSLTRVATGVHYTVRLRHREYAYYETDSDFMFLLVRETGKPFIAYSLHDTDARFIGLNLNWMVISCHRATSIPGQPDRHGQYSIGNLPASGRTGPGTGQP